MSDENKRITKLENNIKELKKKLEYINKNVQIVLGRHSSQIRVLESDGSWGIIVVTLILKILIT